MKVQILVKCSSKLGRSSEETFDVVLTPTSTVSELKERVSSLANIVAFPKQSLKLKGSILADSEIFETIGVVEGDVMELIFESCEQTLIQQFSDLLRENSVSLEEMHLLYMHQYGTSAEDVIQRLGLAKNLRAFLEDSKCFCFDGGFVKLFHGIDFQTKPAVCNNIQVKVSVVWSSRCRVSFGSFDDDVDDTGTLLLGETITVAEAKQGIAASELVPFTDLDLVLRGKKLKDELSLNVAGVKDGDSLILQVHASEAALVSQFEQLLHERVALSANELSLLYCQRFGAPACQALRSLGLHGSINRFLEKHPAFAVSGGCVTLVNDNVLEFAISVLSAESFLNISSVVTGGCGPCGEPMATIFVKGVPVPTEFQVLESLRHGVVGSLLNRAEFEDAAVANEIIKMKINGRLACLHLVAAPSS